MNQIAFKKSFWLLTLCVLLSINGWCHQAQLEEGLDQEVEAALYHLPSEGFLKQAGDGYVYLKVPDKIAYTLFPLVKEPGFELPNSIRRHTKVGAHISIMYTKEAKSIPSVHELGEKYSFEPKRIRHVRSGAKEYIILEVEAPQLEKIRTRYGLSPKLMNHEFHITIAEKRI